MSEEGGCEPEKLYTYQDYLQLSGEPGYRYEILEGELAKDPGPSTLHQLVSQRVFEVIKTYFTKHDPGGLVFYAPLDVTLADTTVVQPDILYVSSQQRHIVKDTRIDGSPTLIVEILSASTGMKDKVRKLQIYQTAGVKHYWLVDPENQSFQGFVLEDSLYKLVVYGKANDRIIHPELPGMEIDLQTLWHMD